MIYYPKSGKLKIKTKTQEQADFICETFARVVLEQPDFFALGPQKPVYDFDCFKSLRKLMPSSFDLDPADGIETVKVTALHFTPDALTRDTVMVNSVKNLSERIRKLGIDLSLIIDTAVNI